MVAVSETLRDPQQGYSFTEREDFEKGVGIVFRDKIVPGFRQMERERIADKKRAIVYMILAVVTAVLLSVLVFVKEYDPDLYSVYGTLAFAYILYVFFKFNAKHHQKSRGKVIQILFHFMGYSATDTDGIDIENAKNLGVVGDFHTVKLDERAEGSYKNFGLAVSETHLVGTSGIGDTASPNVAFRGLLCQITTKANAPRMLLYYRPIIRTGKNSSHYFDRWKTTRLDFEDAAFSEKYSIYSDQPDAVHDFVDDRLIEMLSWLAGVADDKGWGLRCGLEADKLFIGIWRNEEFMGLGSPFGPPRDLEEDLHTALSSLYIPYQVIDRFIADQECMQTVPST